MADTYTPMTTMTTTATSTKKTYNISETKLKRLLEYNERLQSQLELPRIPVSEASTSLIEYCNSTKDPLIPSVWGPVSKEEDPFAPAAGGSGGESGCCVVM